MSRPTRSTTPWVAPTPLATVWPRRRSSSRSPLRGFLSLGSTRLRAETPAGFHLEEGRSRQPLDHRLTSRPRNPNTGIRGLSVLPPTFYPGRDPQDHEGQTSEEGERDDSGVCSARPRGQLAERRLGLGAAVPPVRPRPVVR